MLNYGHQNFAAGHRRTYHSVWWKIGAFLFALGGVGSLSLSVLYVTRPALASGPSSNRVLNYQIRLTDATGIPTADGTKNIKISFYTAASGGTPVATDCGLVGAPVARKVVFTGGVGTVLIGDAGADGTHNCSDASAPNALSASLFNNTSLFLGITVETDAEMIPRKRIVATGYSLNADMLDDLDTSAVGGSVSFVPVTDSSGNLTLTKNFTADGTTLFVDSTNDRVGIGTVTPTANLEISGTGAPELRIGSTDGAGVVKYGITAECSGGGCATTNGLSVIDRNVNVRRMVFTSVTSGTTTAGAIKFGPFLSGSSMPNTNVGIQFSPSFTTENPFFVLNDMGSADPVRYRAGIGTTTPITQLHVPGIVPAAALATVATGTGPFHLYVQGRYAYAVNNTANTLQVIDIANPAAPVALGSVATNAGPRVVFVQGRYAYTVNDTPTRSFQIFDVGNPSAPAVISTTAIGSAAQSLFVSGRYAYFPSTSVVYNIYDVSNPVAPALVGTGPAGEGARGIFVQGKYLYLVKKTGNLLEIHDVSNPATPTFAGSVATGTTPRAVWVDGRYAYVVHAGSNDLRIFDVSNPAAPALVSTIAAGAGATDIYVQDRRAYVASSTANTLQVFDVSNPALPSSLGTVATGTAPQRVYVQGRFAYVVNNGSATLQTFDLGGAYLQQLGAGGIETGMLAVRNSLSAMDGDFRGGVNIGQSLNVTGDIGTSGGLQVGGNFLPKTDNLFDLGSTALRWKTLHLGPGSVVVHNDNTNTLKATLGFSGSTAQLATDAATPLQVTTGANTGINMTTAGNVGIGFATPSQRLVVKGQTRVGENADTFNDFGSPYQLVINADRADTSGFIFGTHNRLYENPASASTASAFALNGTVDLDGTNSFGSATGVSGTVEKLGNGNVTNMRAVNAFVYNGDGNVTNMFAIRSLNQTTGGVITNAYGNQYQYFANGGTTTNSYGLRIESPDTTGGAITNNYGIFIDPHTQGGTANFALLYNHGTSPFSITGAGNVGIGTANPALFKLQVVGSVGPDANNTYDLGDNTHRWRDLFLGPATLHIGTSTSDEGTLSYNTTTNTLQIDSSGTVDIAGGSGSTGCSVDASGNLNCSGTLAGGGGAGAFVSGGNSFGSAATLGTNDNFDLNFETNNATRMTLAAGGNLGIGEPVPTFKLDINGSSGIRVTGPSMTGLTLKSTSATSDFMGIRWRDTANAVLWSMGNDFNGNGNQDFWLYDNVNSRTVMLADQSATSYLSFGTTNGGLEYDNTSQQLRLFTNGTNKVFVNGTGNVGIGTSTPTSFKLQVAGDAGPNADNTFDLGSASLRWKTLHVGPASLVVHNDTTNTNKMTLGFTGATAQITTNSGTPFEIKSGTTTAIAVSGVGAVTFNGNLSSSQPLTIAPTGHAQGGSTRAIWRLDESSGTASAADVTGTYPLATITGTPTVTTGQFGNARVFGGAADVRGAADAGTVTQVKTGAWSIGMWFISNNSATGLGKNLFAVMDASLNAPFHVKVALNSICAGSTDQGNACAGTVNNGLWYHLVIVHTGAAAGFDVYLNGAFAGHLTVNDSTLTPASPLFVIGNGPHAFFDGTIDDVFFENTALSAGTISTEYAAATQAMLTVTGKTILNGSVGVGTLTPASFKLQVAGNIGPDADNLYDLGSTSLRWKTLHVGPASLVVHNDATNTNKMTLGFTSSTAQLSTNSGVPLEISSGLTTALRIDTTGAASLNSATTAFRPFTVLLAGHLQGPDSRAIWRLDESSGTATAADVTGTYPLATITGTPTVTAGKFGNARVFGGAADVRGAADAGTVTRVKTGAWSFGMWFISNNSATGLGKNLFAVMDASLNAPFHAKVAINSICAGSTDQGNACAGTVNNGLWYHLVIVHTGAAAGFDVYLNGAFAGHLTVNDSTLTPASPLFVIGNGPHAFFDGTIDDVFFENRAMSATEITSEFNLASSTTGLSVASNQLVTGHTSIGNGFALGSTADPLVALNIGETFTVSAGLPLGIKDDISFAPTVAGLSSLGALLRTSAAASTAVAIAQVGGVQSVGRNSGPTLVTDAVGSVSDGVINGTGNVTNLYGSWHRTFLSSSGNATNVIGSFITSPFITSTGTVTNLYGLYINPQTAGTGTNYAIYYNNGANGFYVNGAGSVGIGTSGPNTALDLNGAFSMREMAAPALSPADQGRIYFDATANKFRVSEHGGAYVDLVGGSGANTSLSNLSSVAINTDLLPAAAPTAGASSRTFTSVDTTNNVGSYDSIAIGTDGFPVISYYDTTGGDLKVLKCGNAACSSGNTATSVDTTNDVGTYTSIAIGTDGFPVISYHDVTNFDLKVVKCGNASCSSGNTITSFDTANNSGFTTSIAIGTEGLPVVSFWTSGVGMKVLKCGNASCSSGNTITTVEATAGSVGYTSIAIGTEGFPVVGYTMGTGGDLKVAKCGNAACSAGNTTVVVDSPGNFGQYVSLAVGADGLPMIAYQDTAVARLKGVKCGNSSCTAGNTVTVLDAVGNTGLFPSIAVGTDGLPVISYNDTSPDLKVIKCGNSSCSSGNLLSTVEAAGGNNTSIAVGTDGLPVISYYTGNTDLRVVKCADAACKNTTGGAFSAGSNLGSLGKFFNNVYAASFWGKQFQIEGFDLAETYRVRDSSIEAGDIVRISSESYSEDGGPYVEKSQTFYEATVIGIVSTKPGIALSEWSKDETSRPIALAGRVPVKVTAENGPIQVGDPITSSSTPGLGMKATAAGRILGFALQAWNGENVGKVQLFVEPGWWNGSGVSGSNVTSGAANINDLNIDADLDFRGYGIQNLSFLRGMDGNWSIDQNGLLVVNEIRAKKVKTQELTVDARMAAQKTAGREKIDAGQIGKLVLNPKAKPGSIIVVTFEGNVGTTWWVDEKADGSFMVKLATPALSDANFVYWIIGVDGELSPPSPTALDPVPPPTPEPDPSPDPTPDAAPDPIPPPDEPPPTT